MQRPGRLPLEGDRWTAFVRTLTFQGADWTGATFAMQVRDRKDGGFLRADLGTVASASAEGVRLISAGLVDGVMTSVVGIRINETTMEDIDAATEAGEDADIWWDMHITPSGGVKQKYLYGPFKIRAGVTQ